MPNQMDISNMINALRDEKTHIKGLQEDLQSFKEKLLSEVKQENELLKKEMSEYLNILGKSIEGNIEKIVSHSIKMAAAEKNSLLIEKEQEQLQNLSDTISCAQHDIEEFQRKMTPKWGKFTLLTILTSALAGSFLGLWMILLQTTPLAIFLMDEKARETYKLGAYWMESKKKHKKR